MNLKNINERYHLNSRIQKRVITSKNFTYRILISIVDKYIGKKMRVVDLGCGVGTLDYYLASKGNYILGVDSSKIAVNAARNNAVVLGLSVFTKFIQKDLMVGDISGKYEIVLFTEVIEHLYDDHRVLQLANQLLNKKGILIVSTRSLNAPLYRLNLTKLHDRRVGHLRRYTIGKLRRIVTMAGFKVIEEGEKEGLLRDFLYSFPLFGSPIIRLANKFSLISDFLTFVDNIFLKIFSESQVYLVAKKIK